MLPSTGGAIDLIAVKQRDGSLKCSPFYVRFGKYQGLIRGREKVVTVTVNGVLMDFTMRLGRSGEAFFVVYDPDNPEAGLTANGSESEGESDDDEPEVTGAASVGTDPAARAEPGSRSSEGSDEETTHPYLRSQASVRRRLGNAADGGDGTEARSRISEEEDEDGDGVCDGDEIAGCTDSEACNYDDDATDDDGSCDYAEEGLDCEGNCLEDADGDGFGNPNMPVWGCGDVPGTSTLPLDCQDWNANTYPQAPELCDGWNNDCDDEVDEGTAQLVWYADADGDGFGNDDVVFDTCEAPDGAVAAARAARVLSGNFLLRAKWSLV